MQLLCNSDDDSVNSIFSDSDTCENEIEDLAVVYAIVNNGSDDKEIVTVNQNFI